MHRHTPPVHVPAPMEKLGAWAAAIIIFAAAPLAKWTADTLNPGPAAPARVSSTQPPARPHTVVTHRLQEEAGWDCTVNGIVCGNGTGVDAP